MKRGPDWFLFGMAAAVALAWIFPEPGARGGALHPELVNKLGVALIFFLHGLLLPFEALKAGTVEWRLHPLVGLVLFGPLGGLYGDDLRLGMFYLCALPSTVSSSVALTSAARGNVPAAVFNATLSSVLGVVLTPFWLGLVAGQSGQPLPLGRVIGELVIWLLLPLATGQILRPYLGAWARRHKAKLNPIDRLTILLLVYTSFCDSIRAGVWVGHGVGSLLLVGVSCALLFALVFGVTSALARLAGLGEAERVVAIFCGSKKTLASGVPMAHLIFGAHPGLGLILLPILLYHPLQLVAGAWLAGRWAERSDGRDSLGVSQKN
jgi:sodium/bile acid cotransporter 7